MLFSCKVTYGTSWRNTRALHCECYTVQSNAEKNYMVEILVVTYSARNQTKSETTNNMEALYQKFGLSLRPTSFSSL